VTGGTVAHDQAAAALLEIVRPGLATTVQDRGRPGLGRFGVSPSGAMDPLAHRLANRLLGNDESAATLEVTGPGCELVFLRATSFALAGADLDAALDGEPLEPHIVASARSGARLHFRQRRRGARAFLAVPGGLQAPRVLSSASTDLGAGFGGIGGRPLRAGQRIAAEGLPAGDPPRPPSEDPREPPAGEPPGPPPADPPHPPAGDPPADPSPPGEPPLPPAGDPAPTPRPPAGDPSPGEPSLPPASAALARSRLRERLAPIASLYQDAPFVLRFVPEQDPGVPAEAAARFTRATFRVSSRSGRTGYRFEGEPLPARPHPDRLSEPTAPGAIQLPPDGFPILLMADRNTIGGYPPLGHLAAADRPRAAQLWPGDQVRFEPISLADAIRLARESESTFQRIVAALR
jgi:antagonist of KipI